MCVAGWGGATMDLPPAPAPPSTTTDKVPATLAALFSEEVGYVTHNSLILGSFFPHNELIIENL